MIQKITDSHTRIIMSNFFLYIVLLLESKEATQKSTSIIQDWMILYNVIVCQCMLIKCSYVCVIIVYFFLCVLIWLISLWIRCCHDPNVVAEYQKHLQKKQLFLWWLSPKTSSLISMESVSQPEPINHLYNGCARIKKGLWQPKEYFFRFFFSSSSGTLWSMTIKR